MSWVVMPAAGTGRRFGGDVPKQYLRVHGEPVIGWTLRALLGHARIEGALVVLGPDDAHWPGWTSLHDKPIVACSGGDSRAESVRNGLHALPESVRDDAFVLVHDAARPNVVAADLDRLFDMGAGDPVGAILAAPVRDTLKRAGEDGGIDGTEPRAGLWRALTPQLFRRLQLTRALDLALARGVAVTDEAMAMELQGHRPLLVEGREDNLKITTPADLAYFSWLVEQRG